jgi:hypothetical protein
MYKNRFWVKTVVGRGSLQETNIAVSYRLARASAENCEKSRAKSGFSRVQVKIVCDNE